MVIYWFLSFRKLEPDNQQKAGIYYVRNTILHEHFLQKPVVVLAFDPIKLSSDPEVKIY